MNASSIYLVLFLLIATGLPIKVYADPQPETPAKKFQGNWYVLKHFFRHLQEGATDFDALGDSTKAEFPSRMPIYFRKHESGAIQQIWKDTSGKVVRSKGIKILKVEEDSLIFRPWSDHPTWKTLLTLKPDGTALLQVRSLKHQETFILSRTAPTQGSNRGDKK